jgi:hypothetical protein
MAITAPERSCAMTLVRDDAREIHGPRGQSRVTLTNDLLEVR